jgi:hypothetical protein
MTNGKDLTRNFKVSKTQLARGAQTAMHLRRLKDLAAQFSVVLLQIRKLELELLTARRG